MVKLLIRIIMLIIILMSSVLMAQSKGGRWQFESNAVDSASWDLSSNNGSLLGWASYGQQEPLQEGASYLWLDTTYSENFLKISDNSDLDFSNENIGISAWIYPIKLFESHFFINKGVKTSPPTTNYSLRVSKSYQLEFLFHEDGTQKVNSSFTIPLNKWTFVAVYYDFNAQKVYMWNDPMANAVDTLEFSQKYSANDGPLTIGARYVDDVNNPSSDNFKGRIDDVRISGRLTDILSQSTTALKYSAENKGLSFKLKQNYPNPFNAQTYIRFELLKSEHVLLDVYNVLGIRVSSLIDEKLVAGNYKTQFDAKKLPSGVYFYRLKSGKFEKIIKMLLTK